MFQCPTIDEGGLPPTNGWPGTQEAGQMNDDGTNIVDFQAPRLAYAVNEAICPQNYFAPGFQSSLRTEQYVRAGQVTHSAITILATEFNQNWQIVSGVPEAGGGSLVCKSHRPIHGFHPITGGVTDGTKQEQGLNMPYKAPDFRGRPVIERVTADLFSPNPDLAYPSAPATNFKTLLDLVGRNHGTRKTDAQGRNMKRPTFYTPTDTWRPRAFMTRSAPGNGETSFSRWSPTGMC